MRTPCRPLSLFTALACAAAVMMVGPLEASAQPPDIGSAELSPAGVDESVAFTSRGLTFQGSMRVPDAPAPGVAALLLPGSGPTDRNGNQPNYPGETLRRTADVLAQQGIASYRFDKFGSGETGLAGLPVEQAADYGFDDQVADAAAAAALLSERTGVAAQDLLVVGHSEGGLTALVLATQGATGGGTALLEPLPMRYLDLLSAQIDNLLAAPTTSPADRERLSADTERAVNALRTSGTLPTDLSPELQQVGLSPANARFLAEADTYDPAALAAGLPAAMPTLLTCSDKDLNVSCGQLDALRSSLAHTASVDAHFATAGHSLGELGPLPPSAVEQTLPLPVSGEYVSVMSAWAAARVS